MKYFDVHAHLTDKKYEEEKMDAAAIVADNLEHSVDLMVDVSYDIESSKATVKNANSFKSVYAAIGIHPDEVSNHKNIHYIELEKLVKDPRVVAVGEIGLDYYYTKDNIELQREAFIKQLRLAKANNKTAMLHIRDEKDVFGAYYDALEILKQEKIKDVVLHCFTANTAVAKAYIAEGYYISIGGIVTFSSAKDVQEAVKAMPLEKIVVETDAPYLTPHPFRGKVNYPKYISNTVLAIAKLKGVTSDEVAKVTYANAKHLFKI